MSEIVFLAGATGAIGSALLPLLVEAGYTVYGSSRKPCRVAAIAATGATPVLVDVFEAEALARTLAAIRPGVVVHQLTDLPAGLDPALMAEGRARNARLREQGTTHLVAATVAAGCRRMVAQSIAWAYAPGPLPHAEADSLDLATPGVPALERLVLHTPGLQGAVLRYGMLYGPGTGMAGPTGAMPVHVEAAARAALLAVQRRANGAFNVAEDNPQVSSERAQRELGWHAGMRVGTSPAPVR